MIQLRSIIIPADNCGAKRTQIIHIYGGSKHKSATIGDIVLAAVKVATPHGIVGKKDKVRMLIVRTKKEISRKDGSHIRFSDNAGVIIDAQNNPRGSRIFGPIAREIRNSGYTQIASLAKEIY
ncbi:50S ribosomal protein L14 [Patescibacteria group bacterium]|nr:50S ribosomal protein L14 [Patescibacteria group bacterium]